MEKELEKKPAQQDQSAVDQDREQALREQTDKKIAKLIAGELQVKLWQVEAAVSLIDEGNTIPFIARYRKEATGTLDDEQLRTLDEREDLYRPYRPKRRTRASAAKEKGLQGLADWLLTPRADHPALEEAAKYVSEEKQVASAEEALQGARDIIAEMISDNADYRTWIRENTTRDGFIVSARKETAAKKEASGKAPDSEGGKAGKASAGKAAAGRAEGTKAEASRVSGKKKNAAEDRSDVYEMYFSYEEQVSRIPGHRVLALNRGEKEGYLTVKIDAPREKILRWLQRQVIRRHRGVLNPYTAPVLEEVCEDSYDRLIGPAIEREIRNALTEKAEDGAIAVFKQNLEQLLMQQPIAGRVVLGWDPAFRTGCKLAVVDATGKVLDTAVIYPTAPQNKVAEAEAVLQKLISRYNITTGKPLQYVIVNEAGASVYSASKLASEEFPQFDVGQRSAASIARRLQDPLAELVKIDPKAIGVGQYQHDMNQKKLDAALAGVVEKCVNAVGVDLNTASAPLLSHISGISASIARNIVAWREENGRFTLRTQLLKVKGLGPKAYEQCAGFLRIRDGKNPLDNTAVHPESYEAVRQLAGLLQVPMEASALRRVKAMVPDTKAAAAKLEIGEITLCDILSELEKPGRDPRQDMPAPILRSDVLSMEDLTPGMKLKGTVRNIVDFGAFVDIGVHQDGLVHISRMSSRFIRHPLEAVSVGDIVDVTVLDVDIRKKRISLSMVEK